MKARDLILFVYFKEGGDWLKVYGHICKKIHHEKNEIEQYLNEIKKHINLDNFITILDMEYPEKAKRTHFPPFVIERKDIENYK